MNAESRSQAALTVEHLQQAQRGGVPLIIPGALEVRARRPPGPTQESGARGTLHVYVSTVSDAERLEREREGGGAPRERTATIVARLWRGLLHPWQLRRIWRRPLPHPP